LIIIIPPDSQLSPSVDKVDFWNLSAKRNKDWYQQRNLDPTKVQILTEHHLSAMIAKRDGITFDASDMRLPHEYAAPNRELRKRYIVQLAKEYLEPAPKKYIDENFEAFYRFCDERTSGGAAHEVSHLPCSDPRP
jgi:hypothetical protein